MKKFAFGSIVMMLSYTWFAVIIMVLCVNTLTAAPQDNDGAATQADGIQGNKYVITDRGVIRGKTVDNVDQFLGVPYAAPPIGDLRWRAPIPAAPWHGVRDATKPAFPCAQIDLNKGIRSGSEDCLYLNIYRPEYSRRGQSLPVLVWIHGRNNTNGSGNDYDPSEMVEKKEIIVVTVNYRLTVFGFLALPSLDGESDDSSSGNYGLLDQQAALRWVRRNIGAFGGDPHNVTIAGESAGSDNVCANLISPTAAGLFKKVIMQSGRGCATATHAEVIQTGAMIGADLGCADPNTAAVCLRAKAPADLLEAAKTREFGPNISGRALPLGLQDAVTSNQWNRSPILVGSTHDYASPVIASVGFPLSVQSYEQLVAQKFKSLAPAVLNEYKLENYPDPAFAFSAENTDFERASKAAHLAKLFSDIRVMAETYQYEFDDPDAPPPNPGKTGLNIPPGFSLGSYHGSELQYLFKFSEASRDLSPTQEQLSDQMMQYWANFARTGNPNGQGLQLWPLYNPAAPLVLSFRPSGNIVIDNFDAAHHTAFWAHASIN